MNDNDKMDLGKPWLQPRGAPIVQSSPWGSTTPLRTKSQPFSDIADLPTQSRPLTASIQPLGLRLKGITWVARGPRWRTGIHQRTLDT